MSAWGTSWGASWGQTWSGSAAQVVGLQPFGTFGGGGASIPRVMGDVPVIRLRPSIPGAKARRLGDTEQPVGAERQVALSTRGSIGGGVGRVPRLAPKATAGIAAAGLGGPQPTAPPGAPGVRPRDPIDMDRA